jgi:hypothetical protein
MAFTLLSMTPERDDLDLEFGPKVETAPGAVYRRRNGSRPMNQLHCHQRIGAPTEAPRATSPLSCYVVDDKAGGLRSEASKGQKAGKGEASNAMTWG